MEKKTIGSFIAVLRKANGMTQKELGDKLFVSDKTISRWERDECTPELSLIPVMADLFGITTDELLRGERKREDVSSEETTAYRKAKSERQMRVLLERKRRKLTNHVLIGCGLSVLGQIFTYLGLAIHPLVFALGLILLITGIVYQIYVIREQGYLPEDDEFPTEEVAKFRKTVKKMIFWILFTDLWWVAILIAAIPFFVSLLVEQDPGISSLWFLLLYGAYPAVLYYFLRKKVRKTEATADSTDKEVQRLQYNRRLAMKSILWGGSIAMVLLLVLCFVDHFGFDYIEMASEYVHIEDAWCEDYCYGHYYDYDHHIWIDDEAYDTNLQRFRIVFGSLVFAIFADLGLTIIIFLLKFKRKPREQSYSV